MPCRGRTSLAQKSLECFLAQTWPAKELIIVDDAEKPAFPVRPTLPGVYYWAEPGRKLVGAKRNLAVSRAHGKIIIHWDSDDHSSPLRMRDQVERLLSSGFPVTGYRSMLFLDEKNKRAWRYRGALDFALGSSLCYLKSFWAKHTFPVNAQVGEDSWFVRQAKGRIASVDAGSMMYAREHAENTYNRVAAKQKDKMHWESLAWPGEAA